MFVITTLDDTGKSFILSCTSFAIKVSSKKVRSFPTHQKWLLFAQFLYFDAVFSFTEDLETSFFLF
jgi:hypothetical protein